MTSTPKPPAPPKSKSIDLSYPAFVRAVGARESGNKYSIKNQYGYMGRFQFGMARLADLGLCQKIPGKAGVGKNAFSWKPGYSEKLFLESPELQDKTFDLHVSLLAQLVELRHHKALGTTVLKVPVTLSGSVAVCHLLGEGGLVEFLAGKDEADALGTQASEYMALFMGFDIPVAVKQLASKHAGGPANGVA